MCAGENDAEIQGFVDSAASHLPASGILTIFKHFKKTKLAR